MAPSPVPQSPSRPAEINAPHSSAPSHTAGILIGVLLALAVVIILSLFALYFLRRRRAHNLGEAPPSFLPVSNPFARRPAYSRNYPARGGVLGWAGSQWRKVRSGRTARGAYEGTSNVPGGGGGAPGRTRSGRFQALDPDEAWDSRVGGEADVYGDPSHTAYAGAGGQGGYYEEQELGLAHHQRGQSEVYGYAPARGLDEDEHGGAVSGGGVARGKSVLDERYDEEMHDGDRGRGRLGHDPFGDATAERSSMRGVSPRPMEVDTGYGGAGNRASRGTEVSRESLDESPTERRSVFREDV
ncbi:MAG: acid phosphatase pho5 [Chrysothrix sp. TS-e1954]|nr:MAG: acid phosphatase pho5 [Chrysothrix sp. TS-e1954]